METLVKRELHKKSQLVFQGDKSIIGKGPVLQILSRSVQEYRENEFGASGR